MPPAPGWLQVGPVHLPEIVDRPELVQYGPDATVEVLAAHAWQEPLQIQIAQTIGRTLALASGREAGAEALRLPIEIRRLEAHGFQHVLLEAVWALHRNGRDLAARHFCVTEPLAEASIDELARAHGRAVQALAEDVAAGLPHAL
jgi:uncharacterized lipoprotein YmbA